MKTTVYIDIDGGFSKKFHEMSIFIPGPVGILVHAGPCLVVAGLVLEVVGVGGLLNRQIEPVAGVAVRVKHEIKKSRESFRNRMDNLKII